MAPQAGLDPVDFIILAVIALSSCSYLLWRRSKAEETRLAAAKKQEDEKKSAASKSSARSGKKSILEKLRSSENPNQLVLFYGSQTGTAEDLASRLAKEATTTYGIASMTCDCEEYDMTELAKWPHDELEAEGKKWLVGFFMATYGEGEPTDNAVEFYDWLMAGQGKGDDEGNEEDEMTEEMPLQALQYIIFGLGNKTYEHYNAIVRRMDRRLRRLGADRVGDAGEGDDDASLEEDFLAWKPKIFPAIADHFGVVADTAGAKEQRTKPHIPLFDVVELSEIASEKVFYGEHSSEAPRRWKSGTIAMNGIEEYEIINSSSGKKYLEVKSTQIPYDAKHPHYGRILSSRPLFTESYDEFDVRDSFEYPKGGLKRYTVEGKKIKVERHCLHIELDLEGSDLKYESGDHVGVWPVNDDDEVYELAEALKLPREKLDTIIILNPNPANPSSSNAKLPFPMPCTIRTALLHYLDVQSHLKQHHFEILAKYAKDTKEKELLFEYADNRELYVSVMETSQKSLREVLQDFPSVELPIAVVVGEILSRIAVRYYSISSSAKEDPNKVAVTAVMVRYALPSSPLQAGGKGKMVVKQGLATSWFQRLSDLRQANASVAGVSRAGPDPIPMPAFHLPLYIRTSNFKLPRDPSIPVVMVGPGTGVAPFRAFVRERFLDAKNGVSVGATWLFYGCRHPEKDFLYHEEFDELERGAADLSKAGQSFDLKIFKAFSRHLGRKVYVQHVLEEQAEGVWELLGKQKGHFYVCGDAKHMARDVNDTLAKIARSVGGLNEEAAKGWVKDLRTHGRYLEDVWS
ncbi:NADPH-cytochrome P450 reductase [Borealophlyctis nickersoniae]|nr:NADPH-cytochrome P450 reductase [Borealophlyctis nickersoniae]